VAATWCRYSAKVSAPVIKPPLKRLKVQAT
jgi:hypothetical protein